MASVTTHGAEVYGVYNKQDPPYIAPGIDEIGKLGFAREHYLSPEPAGKAAVTDNTPISFLPASSIVSHAVQASFLSDYYNRIHVLPGVLNVGNLLSSQSRDVEVWNAYFSGRLLSSISSSGADGVTVSQPESAPTTFGPLESRIYSFSISLNGPPSISSTYTLSFPSESPEIVITGSRVVIWPFMPQTRHTEGLEWKTDIIGTFNREQRLALRAAPRQSFVYEFILDEQQFSRAKAISTGWASRVYGAPVWSELTNVGPISAGASEIFLSTDYADYRAGGLLLIWQSDTELEAVEIVSVLADRLILALPVVSSYTQAYVAPVRLSRTLSGAQYTRRANVYATASVSFLVTENADLGSPSGYDQYRGLDVLHDPQVIIGNPVERIARSVDLFDNGSGPVAVEINNNWISSSKTISFDVDTREQRWSARQFLHSLRGRQKTFWLPSGNRDLIPLSDLGSASTSITCLPIGYSLYYAVTDIMILDVDGSRYYNRILSSTTDGSGNEVLALQNAVGADLLVSDIDSISFMSHVRLDSDKVDIRHEYGGRVTFSVPVKETPEG